jgi:excisionase family DNA binding protein
MDPLLTTEDVAEFFRVDAVTVRRMIGKGELTAYRVGGEYRFKRTDIDEYLERQRLPAQKKAWVPGKLTQRYHKLVASGAVTGAFERFTKRARNVMALAQEEAQRLHHNYIGTEHVLLGVLREEQGVGARLLAEMGYDLDKMRQAVKEIIGAGPEGETPQGELNLTPRVKKVLELAVDEAKRLDHDFIGTEHLVLGLLREGEGVAGRHLRHLGMELDTARRRVQEILSRHQGS